MKTNRHGYALTEVLVIIVVIVVLMGLSVKPMRTLIAEIPRSSEACQAMGLTEKVLEQLDADIAQARRIVSLNGQSLTLDKYDGAVVYTLADEQITRESSTDRQTWTLPPNVHIEAVLWERGKTPYAVQLKTCNRQVALGREQTRFSQTRIFFQKEDRR